MGILNLSKILYETAIILLKRGVLGVKKSTFFSEIISGKDVINCVFPVPFFPIKAYILLGIKSLLLNSKLISTESFEKAGLN